MAIIFGTNFNDNGTLFPILTGTSLADTIYAYDGNDILNGGAGADTMYGGTGNDTYYVDNSGDVVVENLNAGTDKVFASITYTLTNNVENLTLTGTAAINGYGNSLNNFIQGNSVNNIIYGYGGNDTLDGGAGADTMYGGTGNDTYYVNNSGDLVVESLSAGTDQVFASISYRLTNHVENLTLMGTANLTAEGNSLNNTIIGNSGNNLIYGFGGNDTIYGRDGDDSIFLGSGSGYIYGENGNDSLTGGNETDTIFGGAGDDLLLGNGGDDIVYGGAGADYFLFIYLSEGVDIIKDFEWKEKDKILIDKLGFGATSLDEFTYDSSTGDLFFNSTKFATIANNPIDFNISSEVLLY